MPATQMGHSSAIAPATNIPQPKRISASALSGARRLRGCGRLGAGPSVRRARRASRARRTRNSAPRHSQTSGSAASAPHSSQTSTMRPSRRARPRARRRARRARARCRRAARGRRRARWRGAAHTGDGAAPRLLVVLQPLGLGGDRLEPGQRVCEAGPQGADLCCVSLPGPRPRSHGFNPRRPDPAEPNTVSEPLRSPHRDGRRAADPRGRRRCVDSPALPHQPRARRLPRRGGCDGRRRAGSGRVGTPGARRARPLVGVEDGGDLLDESAPPGCRSSC